MRTLDPETLRPGSLLPLPLFNRQGLKLLAQGAVLTDSTCRLISRSKWGELFLARSPIEVARTVEAIESGLLLPPKAATSPPAGASPAAPGSPPAASPPNTPGAAADAPPSRPEPAPRAPAIAILDSQHDHAADRDAPPMAPSRADIRRRAARLKHADAYAASLVRLWADLPLRIRPRAGDPDRATSTPRPAGTPPASWPDHDAVIALRRQRTIVVRHAMARALAGVHTPIGEFVALIDEMIARRREHPQRFAQLALLPGRRDEDLAEQSYAAAALAVAIAAQLRWSRHHQRLAGLSAMLADIAMAALPSELRNNAHPLSEVEINRVRRHPTLALILLESIDGVPEEVRRAAYEHHERDNGSGYPRGLRAHAISDLSKLAAVATLFAAMTSARKYRLTKRPYDALEDLIMLASTRALDRRVVRALVGAVGLFPVGSWVLLSSGQTAQVIAADPIAFDRPAVRLHRAQHAASVSDAPSRALTIHLADIPRQDLHILDAADAPAFAA